MGEQIRFPHRNRSASKQIGFPHREYLRASRSGFLRGGKSSTCLLIIPDPSANMSSDTPSEHSGRTFSFSPMPNFCSPNTGEDGDRSLDPELTLMGKPNLLAHRPNPLRKPDLLARRYSL